MSSLREFPIAEFTEALAKLAWPLAICVIVLAFRSEISDLIKRFRGGSVGDKRFDFDPSSDTMQKFVSMIEEHKKEKNKSDKKDKDIYETETGNDRPEYVSYFQNIDFNSFLGTAESAEGRFAKYISSMVTNDPKSAIVLISAELERRLREVVAAKIDIMSAEKAISLTRAARMLESRDVLSEDFIGALREFSKVRNAIAHGGNLEGVETENFAYLGLDILRFVKEIPRERFFVEYILKDVFYDDSLQEKIDGEILIVVSGGLTGATGTVEPVLNQDLKAVKVGDELAFSVESLARPMTIFYRNNEKKLGVEKDVVKRKFKGKKMEDIHPGV